VLVKSRTQLQVKNHAQKFFQKAAKQNDHTTLLADGPQSSTNDVALSSGAISLQLPSARMESAQPARDDVAIRTTQAIIVGEWTEPVPETVSSNDESTNLQKDSNGELEEYFKALRVPEWSEESQSQTTTDESSSTSTSVNVSCDQKTKKRRPCTQRIKQESVNGELWTDTDDYVLLQKAALGRPWKEIAKCFPYRDVDACRDRFNHHIKPKLAARAQNRKNTMYSRISKTRNKNKSQNKIRRGDTRTPRGRKIAPNGTSVDTESTTCVSPSGKSA